MTANCWRGFAPEIKFTPHLPDSQPGGVSLCHAYVGDTVKGAEITQDVFVWLIHHRPALRKRIRAGRAATPAEDTICG